MPIPAVVRTTIAAAVHRCGLVVGTCVCLAGAAPSDAQTAAADRRRGRAACTPHRRPRHRRPAPRPLGSPRQQSRSDRADAADLQATLGRRRGRTARGTRAIHRDAAGALAEWRTRDWVAAVVRGETGAESTGRARPHRRHGVPGRGGRNAAPRLSGERNGAAGPRGTPLHGRSRGRRAACRRGHRRAHRRGAPHPGRHRSSSVGRPRAADSPSIAARLGEAAGTWSTRQLPTATQRAALESATANLSEATKALTDVLTGDLARLQRDLAAAGAPYIPGQRP